MTTQAPSVVVGQDGWQGTLIAQDDEYAVVRLDGGQQIHVPLSLLRRTSDTRYHLALGRSDLERYVQVAAPADQAGRTVIPVLEETVRVATREVESGRVRIQKRIETREEQVDVPLMREEVTVERVAVNRYLDGQELPAVRHDGDTLIIPLVEEVLVVEKRLLLRDELHVRKARHEYHDPQTVTLRREDVTVERLTPATEPDLQDG